MIVCQRCAADIPEGFRFCGACGAALDPDAPGPGRRKIVTAMFCDVAGSTALAEDLDPELVSNIVNRYFLEMRSAIERHGGTVQKFAGDAIMAVFGIPRVHEDDALRAVRAAIEIRERLPAVAEEIGVSLRFRTGINTGLVITDEGRSLAIGDAINVAARLEAAAEPDEILLGAATLQLVRDAVGVESLAPLQLKGKGDLVAAFRLVSVDLLARGHARAHNALLVGRDKELARLHEAWGRAIDEAGCHLFTLLGPAGVGKSRIAAELLSQVGDRAMALSGRCLPYGDGITFWPLIEALAAAGDAADDVRRHLTSGGPATAEELFWRFAVCSSRLRTSGPWFFSSRICNGPSRCCSTCSTMSSSSPGTPILVLCTARLELLEERPAWGGGKFNATSVLIEPLAHSECEALFDHLGGDLKPEVRTRVIKASDGNPLFLEEMVELARDHGTEFVPPTIQALLAARFEGLPVQQREPLERGSVEGLVFHARAIQALSEPVAPAEIDGRLIELVRKDLIRPHPETFVGDDAFRFRHLLSRDAAYERLPMATRAELHERFARWLEEVAVDLLEFDELAGWHLEQAVAYRRALRLPVEATLARDAASHLHAAGRRAADRNDVIAARTLLARALALVPDDDALASSIAGALAERLIEAGDLAQAAELLSLAEREGEEFGPASLHRLEWLVHSRPGEALTLIESLLPRMLAELERRGDERGLARAHWLSFWVQWGASQATRAGKEVRAAAEHARNAGDIGLWSRALGWYVATLMFGPLHANTLARELDEIDRQEPGPYLAACVSLGRAEVARMQGQIADAVRAGELARVTFQALGIPAMAATCEQSLGTIAVSAGDPARAIDSLNRSDSIFSELGETALRSTTQAHLARAYGLLPDSAAADRALQLAEELTAPEDVANFAIIERVRSGLARATGDRSGAFTHAHRALEYALRTDFVGHQAEARLELAHALLSSERTGEAGCEAQAALALFEAKGDVLGIKAAKNLLRSGSPR